MTNPVEPQPTRSSDPYRFHVWALLLFVLSFPALIVLLYITEPHTLTGPPVIMVASSAIVTESGGIDKLLASDLYTQGRDVFIATCTACHGPQGQAKPHLGKDIANSAFVAQRTDEQMVDFIKTGRPADDPLNTTGVTMPPKGGNPAITDAQIHQIIAYIRVLQAAAKGDIQLPATTTSTTPPAATASTPSATTAESAPATPNAATGLLASSDIVNQAGGIDHLLASDLFKQGRANFITSCTACHGPEGQAKPYLGKDIAHSVFVAQRTDDQLVTYIKTGRPVDDPLNTTGVPMPPKGGNPAITDAQIHQIIAYIRALQAAAMGDIQLPPTPAG